MYVTVGVCVNVCGWVGGCADGSWEADTVQENRPLATDLFFGRWRFKSNSHPASQWPWPPNISITSSSADLPQPVTQERGEGHTLSQCARARPCLLVGRGGGRGRESDGRYGRFNLER